MDPYSLPSAISDILDPFPFPSPPPSSSPEPLFLVPFRWWVEVINGISKPELIVGVQYSAEVTCHKGGDGGVGDDDVEDSIMLHLKREVEVEVEVGRSETGDFALISEWMFLRALKWHFDANNGVDHLDVGDSKIDLFKLKIRISFSSSIMLLIIKIARKDNSKGDFLKARTKVFMKSSMVKFWDFSGRTSEFVDNNLLKDLPLPDNEILLELQMYGMSGYNTSRDNETDEMLVEGPNTEGSTRSLELNGNGDSRSSDSTLDQSLSTSFSYGDVGTLGLTGLDNLGNTCFLNSAIQCLAHTGKLVDFFLEDFRKDINVGNPLGMEGKLAIAFGDLLRKLWAPGASPVSPGMFKSAISDFAPQFSGYSQHDSQEFLAFLLDGLHEDLNRVKSKPYIESKDDDTRPDEIIAEEHWQNHLARNRSIIVDLFQGQYRSTLVCPDCQKKSVTFDPFMYLSLPLPSVTMRTMTLTLVSCHGTFKPFQIIVRVPQDGTSEDLLQALSSACELRNNETLTVVEIYGNKIFRVLDSPSDSIELIRDADLLVAYRMSKEEEDYPLIEFIHRCEESHTDPEQFGLPLLARIPDFLQGSEIRKLFLKLISPFLLPPEESVSNIWDDEHTSKEEAEMVEPSASSDNENALPVDSDFQFVLDDDPNVLDDEPNKHRYKSIQMDEPVPVLKGCREAKVLVYWSPKLINKIDTKLLRHIPPVYRASFRLRRVESITLDKCLDAFLKEEPLGPDDMWYCANCKKHQQASKKLDIWRLPEILVIHLKRFSYNKYSNTKMETFVDFPINDFDLSNFLMHKCDTFSHRYSLYAVSNHYGIMGGGHYTAFAQHKHKKWYQFDDQQVSSVNEDEITTAAAYVLFYKRI